MTQKSETAWLIELETPNGPQYLCVTEFNDFDWSGHLSARRYPTEDAAREAWLAVQSLDESMERFASRVRITEHEWVAP